MAVGWGVTAATGVGVGINIACGGAVGGGIGVTVATGVLVAEGIGAGVRLGSDVALEAGNGVGVNTTRGVGWSGDGNDVGMGKGVYVG